KTTSAIFGSAVWGFAIQRIRSGSTFLPSSDEVTVNLLLASLRASAEETTTKARKTRIASQRRMVPSSSHLLVWPRQAEQAASEKARRTVGTVLHWMGGVRNPRSARGASGRSSTCARRPEAARRPGNAAAGREPPRLARSPNRWLVGRIAAAKRCAHARR